MAEEQLLSSLCRSSLEQIVKAPFLHVQEDFVETGESRTEARTTECGGSDRGNKWWKPRR